MFCFVCLPIFPDILHPIGRVTLSFSSSKHFHCHQDRAQLPIPDNTATANLLFRLILLLYLSPCLCPAKPSAALEPFHPLLVQALQQVGSLVWNSQLCGCCCCCGCFVVCVFVLILFLFLFYLANSHVSLFLHLEIFFPGPFL